MFFVDGHCDTITTAMRNNENLYKNNGHIDIERLKLFDNPVQVFAIWLEKEKLKNPFFHTMQAINFFENELEKNKNDIVKAKNYYEITKNMKNNKVSSIIGIEGCEAFEGKIENIYKFFEEGVRIFTITWNYENELGFGAATESKKGLKDFGKEAVSFLNKLGGIIDVSHLNEQGFWDIYKLSNKPFIASHSNSKKICNNLRNLSDEQIKAIIERKGIIGINLYPDFLTEKEICDIESIIRHIDYMLKLGGENTIGIGCDFDGIDKSPIDISQVTDIYKLNEKIVECFGRKIASKIMGENFLEFFKINLL